MSAELTLTFSSSAQVNVSFEGTDSGQLPFSNPITDKDRTDIRLPWELLHDPRGVFLFREKPHISVRRKITGAVKGRKPFQIEKKKNLHLLFVVSRPRTPGSSTREPIRTRCSMLCKNMPPAGSAVSFCVRRH